MNLATKAINMVTYINGNTEVQIYSDGTKVRTYQGDPLVDFPESIDVKITNYCDMGCAFCHEKSTEAGVHGDINVLLQVLSPLPAGVELAIGGGNPLSHPDLLWFLTVCKERGHICNITVNQGHLMPYKKFLTYLVENELVYGIGISINSKNTKYLEYMESISNNVVYHLVAGVHEPSVVDMLMEVTPTPKILILGYKYFGFGVSYFSESVNSNLKEWYWWVKAYIGRKCLMSFDNLAIEQLKVKEVLTEGVWEEFYMGDDFQFTMYIDAVEQMFSKTSRSSERTSFSSSTLLQYFKGTEIIL